MLFSTTTVATTVAQATNYQESKGNRFVVLSKFLGKLDVDVDILKMRPLLSSTIIGLLSVICTTASFQAQPSKPQLPTTSPDTVVQIERRAGNCPKSIGIWTDARQYEGGGEFTIIPDTLAFAGRAKLVAAKPKFVEYVAKLKPAYTNCIARAKNTEINSKFRFANGNIYFQLYLPADTDANPSGFSTRSILAARPYIQWQIAD